MEQIWAPFWTSVWSWLSIGPFDWTYHPKKIIQILKNDVLINRNIEWNVHKLLIFTVFCLMYIPSIQILKVLIILIHFQKLLPLSYLSAFMLLDMVTRIRFQLGSRFSCLACHNMTCHGSVELHEIWVLFSPPVHTGYLKKMCWFDRFHFGPCPWRQISVMTLMTVSCQSRLLNIYNILTSARSVLSFHWFLV